VLATTVDVGRIRALVRDRMLSIDGANDGLSAPARRMRVRDHALAVLREERAILSSSDLTVLVNQVSDEVVGLGPIERLLRDPEVSEVMVNGADDVYVERKGRIERAEGLFLAMTYLTHHAE
jgi:pilus assembly protein CpaF